jgi:hypothetical protein
MSLSPRSVDTLLDLVEIKLSCIEVIDREDARELAILETARRELAAIKNATRGQVIPLRRSQPMPSHAA